jgi:hypothetical protein
VRLPVWETNDINGAGAAPQVVGRISRFPDRERRHYRCTPAQKRTTVSANRHDWASPGNTTQTNRQTMNPSHPGTRLPLARHLGVLCLALVLGSAGGAWAQSRPNEAMARQEASEASLETLKKRVVSGSPEQRGFALKELGQRRTAGARKLLLQIALGEFGKRDVGPATTYFLQSLEDKSEARALLRSDNDYIVGPALSAMRGIALDAGLWEEIWPRMESSDLWLRFTCVGLLQDDPAGFDPVAKVSALLASLTSAVDLPAAKERSGFDGMVISGHTQLDDYFSALTRTLASAKDVTVEVLRGQTPAEDGLAREAVIIARRRRGDREVASEIRQVMETGHVTMARLMAIEMRVPRDGRFSALEPEEIEVLRRVASTDPYSFRGGQRWRGHRPELRFPVREAAVSALERDTAWLIREEVSAQVRQLAQAYANYDQPRKEELRRQLVAGGDAVLAAILLERHTLLTGTNREAAESVLATLPGPKAEQTAIDFLLASTNAPIESDLGRIFIPRAHQEGLAVDLPLEDWNRILERILPGGRGILLLGVTGVVCAGQSTARPVGCGRRLVGEPGQRARSPESAARIRNVWQCGIGALGQLPEPAGAMRSGTHDRQAQGGSPRGPG